jgi:hypothetical protein
MVSRCRFQFTDVVRDVEEPLPKRGSSTPNDPKRPLGTTPTIAGIFRMLRGRPAGISPDEAGRLFLSVKSALEAA